MNEQPLNCKLRQLEAIGGESTVAVLTDILIAPEAEAPAIIAQWPASRGWPSLQTTGLDWLLLSDLANALNQPELAQSLEELGPSVSVDDANGPWIYVLPTGLRDAVAGIARDDLGAVAASWAEGEEATARDLTAQDAERLLVEIQALALRARGEQKPMLLWVSL